MPQRILQKQKTHKLTISFEQKKLKLTLTIFEPQCDVLYTLYMYNQKNVPFWVYRRLHSISNLYKHLTSKGKRFDVIREKGIVRVYFDDEPTPYLLNLKKDKNKIDKNNFEFFQDKLRAQSRKNQVEPKNGEQEYQMEEDKNNQRQRQLSEQIFYQVEDSEREQPKQGQEIMGEVEGNQRKKSQKQNMSSIVNPNEIIGEMEEILKNQDSYLQKMEVQNPFQAQPSALPIDQVESNKQKQGPHINEKQVEDINAIQQNANKLMQEELGPTSVSCPQQEQLKQKVTQITHPLPQSNMRILRTRHKKQAKTLHSYSDKTKQIKKDQKQRRTRSTRELESLQKTPFVPKSTATIPENALAFELPLNKIILHQQNEIIQLRSTNFQLKNEIKQLRFELEVEKRKNSINEKKLILFQVANETKQEPQQVKIVKWEWEISELSQNNQNFSIKGLKVRREKRKSDSSSLWSFLYLSNGIGQEKQFSISIRIHKCEQSNIGIGITSKKNSYKNTCWNEKDCIEYVGFSKRVFEAGNSRFQSGYGINEGDVIVMSVSLKSGAISWKSERGIEAEFQSKKLINPKQIYVPFIRLKDEGDCVQFLNS